MTQESHYTLEDDERVDKLLDLLTTQHCRSLLTYFGRTQKEVASVPELADKISKEDHGGTYQVAIQLRHSTLPRLEDAGVIEYDPRSETVRYQGDSDLEALLDAISETGRTRLKCD